MSNDAILNIDGEVHNIKLGEDRASVFNNRLYLNDEELLTVNKELINIVRSDLVTIDLSDHPFTAIRVAFSTRVTIIISDTPYERIDIKHSDVTIITKTKED